MQASWAAGQVKQERMRLPPTHYPVMPELGRASAWASHQAAAWAEVNALFCFSCLTVKAAVSLKKLLLRVPHSRPNAWVSRRRPEDDEGGVGDGGGGG